RRAPAGGGVDPGMIGHDDWARRVLNDASVHPLARFVNRWQVRVVSAIGGEGKESNLPSPTRRDKPVLKTGGATGPLPSPRDDRALNVAARRRVAKTPMDTRRAATVRWRDERLDCPRTPRCCPACPPRPAVPG